MLLLWEEAGMGRQGQEAFYRVLVFKVPLHLFLFFLDLDLAPEFLWATSVFSLQTNAALSPHQFSELRRTWGELF